MFAYPIYEDLINGEVDKNKIFYLIEFPLNYGSTSNIDSSNLSPEIIKKASFNIFNSNFGDIRKKYIEEVFLDEDLKEDLIKFNEKSIFDKFNKLIKDLTNKYDNVDKKFVFIGGNHLSSYFTIKALKPDLVIHFDAHSDTDPLENKLKHSNFMRFLLEDPNLNMNLIQIGLSNTTKEEINFLKNNEKVLLYKSSLDFYLYKESILKDVLEKITNIVNIKKNRNLNIYLTIDLDVFESFIASYQAEVLGIKVTDFLIFLKHLIDNLNKLKVGEIVGFDITEYQAHKDINEYWANTAARILIEIISML